MEQQQLEEKLLQHIAEPLPAEDGVRITWLGQSGYVLQSREGTVLIDPYLSDHLTRKYAATEKPHIRMSPIAVHPERLTVIDWLLSTHKHSDHMDPETIPAVMEASPHCRLIVPTPHLEHVRGWGLDMTRVTGADADRPLKLGRIETVPIPSAHDRLDRGLLGYPHLGYMLRMGGLTLYHAGDCVPYDGLAARLLEHRPDVALLPVNGRDERRRKLYVPGNFTVQEALCLAAVCGIKLVIPHHYNLFTFNTIQIEQFVEWAEVGCPDQSIRMLELGEAVWLRPDEFHQYERERA